VDFEVGFDVDSAVSLDDEAPAAIRMGSLRGRMVE